MNEQPSSYIFPFLWLHGEDEATLRKYVRVIHDSCLNAFCVESRPHPAFVGPQWWHDMDIILEEARSLGMQLWILDDSHFPTGYAAGAMVNAPAELCRQSLVCQAIDCPASGEWLELSLADYAKAQPAQLSMMEQYTLDADHLRTWDDDQLISLVAVKEHGTGEQDLVDLNEALGQETLRFQVPEGKWKLHILHLTRNRGPHRDYINMMSAASCRRLIDAVYEPHWAHYQSYFGSTIAGFFSDEPELGNGHLYESGKAIWQMEDHAWSDGVTKALREAFGAEWSKYLPLLWEQPFDSDLCARVRLTYMDAVTHLVEQNFSEQVGDWCRAHGVKYIGHVIEDNNQHSRTGSSLGHYFRALGGQDMAGIDDIGGQVLPQGEWNGPWSVSGEVRNGRFYHFVLGRLGASLAAIDPRKHGDCMCEIFGNYGWEEGVRLEKYLADHFLVRGVNHFVPHAFSMKDYPDPDCPPHFYAHGHHPQYRHFGMLMAYMNRMCALLKSGQPVAETAILYSAESDWMGSCMPLEEIAEPLARCQISYNFIPADVFSRPQRYGTDLTDGLCVNGRRYRALILPSCNHLPPCVEAVLPSLREKGICVIDAGMVAPLMIPYRLQAVGIQDAKLIPSGADVRSLHGHGERDYWIFVNEGSEPWSGLIDLPATGACYLYDAWRDGWLPAPTSRTERGTRLSITLRPLHSTVLIFGEAPKALPQLPEELKGHALRLNRDWRRSVCRAIDYPAFGEAKLTDLPDTLAEEMPKFSGVVRYEREITLQKLPRQAQLVITDAHEGVEAFVNGKSQGIQIVPPFRFELTPHMRTGINDLRIEVATTLERENADLPDVTRMYMSLGPKQPVCPSGISGSVLWMDREE